MRIIKYLAILPLSLSFISFVQAKENIAHPSSLYYQVPFHHVQIQSGQKIRANYQFDSLTQTIVCTQSTDFLESVEWQYKDVSYKGQLPLTLKDSSDFQGQSADPNGTLTITNEFGDPNIPMSVSCEYRKMK
jgi:hypothetical protein